MLCCSQLSTWEYSRQTGAREKKGKEERSFAETATFKRSSRAFAIRAQSHVCGLTLPWSSRTDRNSLRGCQRGRGKHHSDDGPACRFCSLLGRTCERRNREQTIATAGITSVFNDAVPFAAEVPKHAGRREASISDAKVRSCGRQYLSNADMGRNQLFILNLVNSPQETVEALERPATTSFVSSTVDALAAAIVAPFRHKHSEGSLENLAQSIRTALLTPFVARVRPLQPAVQVIKTYACRTCRNAARIARVHLTNALTSSGHYTRGSMCVSRQMKHCCAQLTDSYRCSFASTHHCHVCSLLGLSCERGGDNKYFSSCRWFELSIS